MRSTLAPSLLPAGGPSSVHDFRVEAIDGAEVSLSPYRGQGLLIVNTASECGYTPRSKGLERPYQACKGRGLEVLAFPSNDSGGQEPGTGAELRRLRERRHRTAFPLFAKVPVEGPKAEPPYRYLTSLPVNGGEVAWNFDELLVDPEGAVVAHLGPSVEPPSLETRKRIEETLPGKP